MYVPRSVRVGEAPRSTFFPPPPRVSMLQPRLVPAFFGCETSGIYLTCINRALFPVPQLTYLGCRYLYLSLFYIVLSIDAARGR